jgi:hypothetical protein
MTKLLDNKANINLFLRQILPPTYIISFAIRNITIMSSGYNIAQM